MECNFQGVDIVTKTQYLPLVTVRLADIGLRGFCGLLSAGQVWITVSSQTNANGYIPNNAA